MNAAQVDAYLRRLGVEQSTWPSAQVDAYLRRTGAGTRRRPPSTCCAICICAICRPCPSRTCRSTSVRRSCWRRSGCWTRWWARGGEGSATNSTARSGRCSRAGLRRHAARGTGVRGGGATGDPVRPSRAAGADGGRGRVAGRRRVRGAQSPSAGVRGAGRAGGSRGTFRIVEAGPDGAGLAGRQGRAGAPYRLETRPRELGDFVAGAWWHSTSPAVALHAVAGVFAGDGGRRADHAQRAHLQGDGGRRDAGGAGVGDGRGGAGGVSGAVRGRARPGADCGADGTAVAGRSRRGERRARGVSERMAP